MTTRTTYNSGTAGAVTGDDFMDQYDAHVERLYNASILRLTSIAGTADAVTAVVDPVLEAGLVAGMSFWFDAIADNTGAMTMVIGSEASVDIVDADGAGLETDAVLNGTSYLLYYDGADLRIVSQSSTTTDRTALFTRVVFSASGTSTKPTGFPDDGQLTIEVWAGGGGGHSSNTGGGGGAYNKFVGRGADHSTTETVTVGAGGAIGVAGGNSSVGSLVAAFGGGAGGSNGGGGGGGQISAGGNGGSLSGGAGGSPDGGSGSYNPSGSAGNGYPALFGGGGGSYNKGGDSLYGGAGGGGGVTGGVSVYGGNGGVFGGGVIPGGGGGRGGAGARGQIIITWLG